MKEKSLLISSWSVFFCWSVSRHKQCRIIIFRSWKWWSFQLLKTNGVHTGGHAINMWWTENYGATGTRNSMVGGLRQFLCCLRLFVNVATTSNTRYWDKWRSFGCDLQPLEKGLISSGKVELCQILWHLWLTVVKICHIVSSSTIWNVGNGFG